ncbi:MAG: glucose-6-phosphate isomerase [Gammaproteobacteria bacterium]|nr:MAG: glucose-6-phosphate isomerase [Gammaproteobacteria bacterium]
MNGITTDLTQSVSWKDLKQHFLQIKNIPIVELFSSDPQRAKKFSLTEKDIYFDYSKNPIVEKTLNLLAKLADNAHLKQHIDDLFSGASVNTTQQLPALHTALRDPRKSGLIVKGEDVLVKIHACLNKMHHFVEQIHKNQWRSFSGKKITDIINVGIGGSDLGPLMAVRALKPLRENSLHFHFISQLDEKTLQSLLEKINLETSLFIITSKSFTTCETLLNASILLKIFQEKFDSAPIKRHFLAVTSEVEKAITFGIDPECIFPLWAWVGGRYSLWSAVGLPIALAIGMTNFLELLRGAHAMDQHFFHQPWLSNMPVLLGLLGIWQINFFQCSAHAILPYDSGLKYLPAYLQQLEMESNGKSMRTDNKPVNYATCPIIFGDIGLNAQHAFNQLFHQGTAHFSADFICILRDPLCNIQYHQQIIASALSQSKAFMEGYHSDISYKNLQGNHANNMLALNTLNPFSLGQLIALYEHKVFVQSVIWQINPFDQWGVEYGKQLNKKILQSLNSPYKPAEFNFDSSTQSLIQLYQQINA